MFDTLAYAKKLQEAGFSQIQAETLAEASRDFIDQNLATKSDIAMVQRDIEQVRAELKRDMAELKVDLLKWIVGLLLVQTGIIAGIVIAVLRTLNV